MPSRFLACCSLVRVQLLFNKAIRQGLVMRVISCDNRLPAKGLRIYTGPGTPGVLDDPCHISLCTLCDHFLSPSPGTVCANPVALFRGAYLFDSFW